VTNKEMLARLEELGVDVDKNTRKNELENILNAVECEAVSDAPVECEAVSDAPVEDAPKATPAVFANKPGKDWIVATRDEILSYQKAGTLVGACKGYALLK